MDDRELKEMFDVEYHGVLSRYPMIKEVSIRVYDWAYERFTDFIEQHGEDRQLQTLARLYILESLKLEIEARQIVF